MKIFIKVIVVLIILMSPIYILFCEEWKLVEGFDNTETHTHSNVQTIRCYDSTNCFAVIQHTKLDDYGSLLYNSVDGGVSWKMINTVSHGTPYILNVNKAESPRPKYFFILSDDESFIEKSVDSGKTFKTIELDFDNKYPSQFAMYDSLIGIVTSLSAIFITTDGWETFNKFEKLDPDQTYYSPIFLDSNTIIMAYASRENPKGMAIVKYHLDENKWDTLSYLGFNSGSDQTANDFNRIYDLFFVNDTLGYGCGSSRVHNGESDYFDMVYKTTDGGYTWETVLRNLKHPEVGVEHDIAFADENNGVAVGYWGKIAMTNDGGMTWQYEPYPNDMSNCRKMLVTWAGKTPLIGTWDAGIFRYEGDFFKFPDDTTSVVEDYDKEGIEIYPNPAWEYINISYPTTLSEREGEIEICNIIGRCVIKHIPTLPPHALPEGRSTVQIDVSHLPAGVYFVRVGNETRVFAKN